MTANIYTNDGGKESSFSDRKDFEKESAIWKANKSGAWKNGQVIRSSLSFGYRYGTATSSLGTSWKGVQDFLQNGLHRHVLPTPYYLDYSQIYQGMYYGAGPKNIFSAW